MKEAVSESSHAAFPKWGNRADGGQNGEHVRGGGQSLGIRRENLRSGGCYTTQHPPAISHAGYSLSKCRLCLLQECLTVSGDWYPYMAIPSPAPDPQGSPLQSVAFNEFKFQASRQRFSSGVCSSSPLPEMLWPLTLRLSSPGRPRVSACPQHLFWCLILIYAQYRELKIRRWRSWLCPWSSATQLYIMDMVLPFYSLNCFL